MLSWFGCHTTNVLCCESVDEGRIYCVVASSKHDKDGRKTKKGESIMQYLWIEWLAAFFAAIGAINWGFYKFLSLDVIDFLLVPGKNRNLKLFIYFLFALSGLYIMVNLFWK